jgi:hypothetical protein
MTDLDRVSFGAAVFGVLLLLALLVIGVLAVLPTVLSLHVD